MKLNVMNFKKQIPLGDPKEWKILLRTFWISCALFLAIIAIAVSLPYPPEPQLANTDDVFVSMQDPAQKSVSALDGSQNEGENIESWNKED